MTEKLRVKPREGLLIRDPLTHNHIPPEGALVDMEGSRGTVIRRHITAGDLIEISGEQPAAKNALREVGTDQRKAEGVTSPTKSLKKEEG